MGSNPQPRTPYHIRFLTLSICWSTFPRLKKDFGNIDFSFWFLIKYFPSQWTLYIYNLFSCFKSFLVLNLFNIHGKLITDYISILSRQTGILVSFIISSFPATIICPSTHNHMVDDPPHCRSGYCSMTRVVLIIRLIC